MGLADIDPRIERDYGDLTFGSAVAMSSIWLRFVIVLRMSIRGCTENPSVWVMNFDR